MVKKSKKKKDEDLDEELDDWDEDDDWDDDWDEDDEKPEKSKKKKSKKKSSSKTTKWIIAFIIILAILLFIRFKQVPMTPDVIQEVSNLTDATKTDAVESAKIDEGKTTDFSGSPDYVKPAELGGDVISEDEFDELISIDVTGTPELFSNLECKKDSETGIRYISLRIYNTLKEDIKISPKGVAKGYNTFFKIRGLVDMDPGCGTELLRPGEYTECKTVGLTGSYSNVDGVNRLSVTVPGKTEALLVEC